MNPMSAANGKTNIFSTCTKKISMIDANIRLYKMLNAKDAKRTRGINPFILKDIQFHR